MKYLTLYSLVIFMLIGSCKSTNSSTSNDQDNKAIVEQMRKDGFRAAVVEIDTNNSECPVILVMAQSGEKFDPINLEADLKVNQMELWVKFSRLRMAPRCSIAAPISISEAQKKTE